MEPAPFGLLLYRYFFYGWLFRDAGRGNLWERSQAWRHNRDQSRWLPTYMRRWLVMGAVSLTLALFVEFELASPLWSALFYIPCALVVPYNLITGVCWGCLRWDRHFG